MANQDHQKTDAYTGPSDKSCPICLEDFEDRAFVNACFHSFCFLCILQWSEVGNTCPLCKTTYTSLIHKVKANDDYEKYDIKSRSIPANQEVSITEARRFRYSTTAVPGRPAPPPSHMTLPPGHMTRHSRYRVRDSRTPAPEERRRAIYRANLWALPIETGDKRPKLRDISANFFRQNPACTHRLVPWLMRELKVVLGGKEHVEFLIQFVLSLIDKVDLEARGFAEHLTPFLHEKAAHFVHEFVTYARCPYDMIAYDKNVKYSVAGGDSWDPEATLVVPPSIDPSGPGPSGLSSVAMTFEQRIFEELTTTGWDSPALLQGSDSPIVIEDSSSDEVDPDAVTPPAVRGAAMTPPIVRSAAGTSPVPIAPFVMRGATVTPSVARDAPIAPPVVMGATMTPSVPIAPLLVRGAVVTPHVASGIEDRNRASLGQFAGDVAAGRSGRVRTTNDGALAGVRTDMDVSGGCHSRVDTSSSSPIGSASRLQPGTGVSLSRTSVPSSPPAPPSATAAGSVHATPSPRCASSVCAPPPLLSTRSVPTCAGFVLEEAVPVHVGLHEDSFNGPSGAESTCRAESTSRAKSIDRAESMERRKQLQSCVDDERRKRRGLSPQGHSRRSRKGNEKQSSFMDADSGIDSRRYLHQHQHHTSSSSGGHRYKGPRAIPPPVDAQVGLSPTHSFECLRPGSGSLPSQEQSKPMYRHHHHGDSPSDSAYFRYRSRHSSASRQEHHSHHHRKHSSREQADSTYDHHHHHHHHSSPAHRHHSSPSHHHHSSPSHHHHSSSFHRHHSSSSHHHHSSSSHRHHSSPSHPHKEIDPALHGSTRPPSAVHVIPALHEPDELPLSANPVPCLQTETLEHLKGSQAMKDSEMLSETSVLTVSNVGLDPKGGREGRLLEELTLVEARIRENKKQVLKAALKKERIELLRKSMHKEVCVDKSGAIDASS